MSGVLENLGKDTLPNVFSALSSAGLTESVSVIRSAKTADEYGGEILTDSPVLADIPATYKPISGNARFVEGGEWTTHLITMPTMHGGAEINLSLTDKLLMAERAVSSPERLFQIKSIRNKSGVVYEVICGLEEQ